MQKMWAVLFAGILCTIGMSGQGLPATEGLGMPVRTAPADYQSKMTVGSITIAADFVGHAVPTDQGPLQNEDYVVMEVAFYGADGAKLPVSWEHFSIRINEKKTPTAAQPFGLAMKSLKDPEWEPPVTEDPKSKGSVNAGGGGAGGAQAGDPKPLPPKMPFPLRRAMEQKAQKSILPQGERGLPMAGLVFFPHRGKDEGIRALELIYDGPAGKGMVAFER